MEREQSVNTAPRTWWTGSELALQYQTPVVQGRLSPAVTLAKSLGLSERVSADHPHGCLEGK